jgi:hypothetical protein
MTSNPCILTTFLFIFCVKLFAQCLISCSNKLRNLFLSNRKKAFDSGCQGSLKVKFRLQWIYRLKTIVSYLPTALRNSLKMDKSNPIIIILLILSIPETTCTGKLKNLKNVSQLYLKLYALCKCKNIIGITTFC